MALLPGVCLGYAKAAAVGELLGDEAIVLGLALGRVVFAEVDIAPVEGDDGLAAGFVEAVRRGAQLSKPEALLPSPVVYRLSGNLCHTVRRRQVRFNERSAKGFC